MRKIKDERDQKKKQQEQSKQIANKEMTFDRFYDYMTRYNELEKIKKDRQRPKSPEPVKVVNNPYLKFFDW